MRFASWERLGLNPRRALAMTLVVGLTVALLVSIVGEAIVGPISPVLGAIAGGVAAYIVATAPRRASDRAAFLQALEAPSLAASANIYLKSTGSRSKTLLMLRSREPMLAAGLAAIRRRVLLGYDPVAGSLEPLSRSVFSESASSAIAAVTRVDAASVDDRGDELDGMLRSMELSDETKFPVFIAVSFFLPIMLMLLASVSHETGLPAILAELVLEVVILDVALAASSRARGWNAGGE